jgi:large subunit ribosomal protein L24e
MAKCNFCGNEIEKGTGKIYVEAKGTILNFCSSKCEKNQLKLGRKARTTEWTNEAHENKRQKKGEQ